jgi:branched-subunit amino acid aminotransferase/4-amino-4-deoxychorismate lyase
MPNADDVRELFRASGFAGDAVARITLSGGIAGHDSSPQVWMTARALPEPPLDGPGLRVSTTARLELARSDRLARHKTVNAWARQLVLKEASLQGSDEALAWTPDGRVWEAMHSNLFTVRSGVLQTPPLEGPVLPGVIRGLVIEQARALGFKVVEVELDLPALEAAHAVFLTNAVRGIRRVGQVGECQKPLGEADHILATLTRAVHHWLDSGGLEP